MQIHEDILRASVGSLLHQKFNKNKVSLAAIFHDVMVHSLGMKSYERMSAGYSGDHLPFEYWIKDMFTEMRPKICKVN